jgi:hypothetical protein
MSCNYEINDKGYGGECDLTGESFLSENKCPWVIYLRRVMFTQPLEQVSRAGWIYHCNPKGTFAVGALTNINKTPKKLIIKNLPKGKCLYEDTGTYFIADVGIRNMRGIHSA